MGGVNYHRLHVCGVSIVVAVAVAVALVVARDRLFTLVQ